MNLCTSLGEERLVELRSGNSPQLAREVLFCRELLSRCRDRERKSTRSSVGNNSQSCRGVSGMGRASQHSSLVSAQGLGAGLTLAEAPSLTRSPSSCDTPSWGGRSLPARQSAPVPRPQVSIAIPGVCHAGKLMEGNESFFAT